MVDKGSISIDLLVEPLTRREREILAHLRGNLTGREIAEKLTIATSSVKWYIRQIYGKLGVHSRRQAVTRAYELGLLEGLPANFIQPGPKHNLPRQLTSFIGREKETTQVKALLEKHALVTLTGSGGVGKTRLELQVAREVLERYPDGVWWVDLAPLSDPGMLAHRVAGALGLLEDAGRPIQAALIDFLKGKGTLIVLDNCEHLLPACTQLAARLLSACPQLKLLASSREVLGMAGETAYRVPSMPFPDLRQVPELEQFHQYEAVRLFVERANAALPGFKVTKVNAAAVVNICQRLDGIPLALELAAARMSILTTEELARRLDDVFRLLTGGSRTGLPRHQTLRAAIDWSYDLLLENERMVLRRLSVFAGGATLAAIEGVCAGRGVEPGAILDTLSSLVNKSIVNVERRQGVETRYFLLETVRQYALEKLDKAGESQVLQEDHLEYFLALAEATEPQLRTPIALERLQALHREVDNLRAALSWALDTPGRLRIEAGLRLATALLYFWHTQNYHKEGYTWIIKGLSSSVPVQVDPVVRAKACFSAGHLSVALGDTMEAGRWIQESLDIYLKNEDPGGVAMAQSLLGEIAAHPGSYEEARQLGEAGLALARGLDDAWLLAWVLCRLGLSFFNEDAHSRPLLEESLAIFEQLGDPLQVGDPLVGLGVLAYFRGDLDEASAYYQKALANAQARQSKWAEAVVLHRHGLVAYEKGEFQKMRSLIQESILIQRENMKFADFGVCLYRLGTAEINLAQPGQALRHFQESLQIVDSPRDIIPSLVGSARVALHMNQSWVAAQLLGRCQSFFIVEIAEEEKLWKVEKKEYERGWAETSARLDGPAFEKAIAEGRAMTLDEAVKQALALSLVEPDR